MPGPVQVAWLTCTEELNRQAAAELSALHPDLPLIAVSEFPVANSRWIAYHPKRTFQENLTEIRERLQSETIARSSLVLFPRVPFWRLRAIAVAVSGANLRVHGSLLRFAEAWLKWHARPQSPVMRWSRRITHPGEAQVPLYANLAYVTARLRRAGAVRQALPAVELLSGIAVIIPSRNGLHLLRECLPHIQGAQQIVIVDNGSNDGTAASLTDAEVIVHAEPLSFARAINIGLARVRHERVLLLNNDMIAEPDFLEALNAAFAYTPDLFCATAQILFPAGVRREETGKAVMREPATETEFPIRCDLPLPGEDRTWVLYGSGGCSLFDTAKLRGLGGLNEALAPAYVEDLDLGFRAWQRGWPSVFCARARVEHRHRSTTSRYWSAAQIDTMVQVNYLRFLASTVSDAALFRKLWNQAIRRLHLAGSEAALRQAIAIPLTFQAPSAAGEADVLALTNGDVAVFPGRARTGKPVVLIATPYLPFPLSHGGAVRIFNLMREAAREFDLVMIAFQEQWQPPAAELLGLCCEITIVRRIGSHYRVSSTRPDTVEEFDSLTFHAAVRETVRKWHPGVVQLEWTQMAVYAADCAPAKTVLVEHDITFELFEQMAGQSEQAQRWRTFETNAWGNVDAVVVMSEKDRARVGSRATVIGNGVDLDRYQPPNEPPEPNRLLFIGSFNHLPNRSGIEWFLREVWPLLNGLTLHIIAGVETSLAAPNVEVEGFVPDVRPAYRRASVVIVPLTESAGTNIKVLEALAMGKPIVSTSVGMNGLDVPGVVVADSPLDFGNAIRASLRNPIPAMGQDHTQYMVGGRSPRSRHYCTEA